MGIFQTWPWSNLVPGDITEHWKKAPSLFRVYIEDYTTQFFWGFININHYKDPYETTRVQWKVRPFFFFFFLNSWPYQKPHRWRSLNSPSQKGHHPYSKTARKHPFVYGWMEDANVPFWGQTPIFRQFSSFFLRQGKCLVHQNSSVSRCECKRRWSCDNILLTFFTMIIWRALRIWSKNQSTSYLFPHGNPILGWRKGGSHSLYIHLYLGKGSEERKFMMTSMTSVMGMFCVHFGCENCVPHGCPPWNIVLKLESNLDNNCLFNLDSTLPLLGGTSQLLSG